MSLAFEQRGQTWVCRETEPSWPIMLVARHVYYGTARLPLTLTLAREHRSIRKDKTETAPTTILTSHVDMLIAAQRKAFAKEAAFRLKQVIQSPEADLTQTVTTMVDAMLERLQASQDEITAVSVTDVELPDDLTPKYTLWPIIPVARPGMLVAQSMSGKSTSALMMSASVVTGQVFIPRLEPRIQGPVLYIGQEETIEQFAARAKMVARGHNLTADALKHLYCVRLKGGSLIDSAELIAEMASTRHAVMVVIDSAQACWGSGGDNVREYASRWFNSVEQIGVPVLIIEHPNLENTNKPPKGDMLAAGTSVKRDRVGHAWQLKSTAIPPGPDAPWRYHVTLSDTKRNYVSKQDDITYETEVYKHEWIRFNEASALTPDTVIDGVPTKTEMQIAKLMSEQERDEGWLVSEVAAALQLTDDRSVRRAFKVEGWRHADWAPHTRYRFSQVEGTGSNNIFNPAKFAVDVEQDSITMPTPPGDAPADLS